MWKIIASIGLLVIFLAIGARAYSFFAEERSLSADLADIATRLAKAKSDDAALEDEAQYLANPLNLEKELRARFNYKKPGETMIIIIPAQSSTATSSFGG